jgi:transcriptional regulator with XRE-family HTH domain
MDVGLISNFLNDRLSTRKAVEEAAEIIGVSAATMYRYKANPDAISLGQLCKLSQRLGLPLAGGAVWTQDSLLGSERRRLQLEAELAKNGGTRLITIPAYTVNDELPEITRLLLQEDYGARAKQIGAEVLGIRAERQRLYAAARYESWEVWNGYGYLDFLNGRGRYRSIPTELREAQVEKFIESSGRSNVHRFSYMTHSPELPMFGCHTPPGIVLVRVDDIHLEFQAPHLVKSFEETFDHLRRSSSTSAVEQFTAFLRKGVTN